MVQELLEGGVQCPSVVKRGTLCVWKVLQYVILQTFCIWQHNYTLQVRLEYSFVMGKNSILIQEAGLELCGERLWPAISWEMVSWCLWGWRAVSGTGEAPSLGWQCTVSRAVPHRGWRLTGTWAGENWWVTGGQSLSELGLPYHFCFSPCAQAVSLLRSGPSPSMEMKCFVT